MSQPEEGPVYAGNHPIPQQGKKSFPVWLLALIAVLGFTVVLVGILAALAVHGFTRYLRAAKTAEARNGVGLIAKSAAAAFEDEKFDSQGVVYHALCAPASSPVPASIASVRGVKYMSTMSEWEIDKSVDGGFACLRFSMSTPQYYQYDYRAMGSGGSLDRFQAIAHGDLDGDGQSSEFVLEGRVGPGDVLLVSPSIVETNSEE
jgi:type IV pilus assembly protein PilA